MTLNMRSISSSDKGWLGPDDDIHGDMVDGRQLISCWRARQCGWRGEMAGVRSGLYGRGFASVVAVGSSWLKCCLGIALALCE